MHKDDMVNHRNVQGAEHSEEDNRDGEEEELVAPEVGCPGLDAVGHVEQRAAKVDEFPREEEEYPRHGGVAGCAGAEHLVTLGGVRVVTVDAEVAAVEAEDDDGEGSDGAAGHDDAVDDHVEEEFGGKDAVFELVKRTESVSHVSIVNLE